MTQYYDENAQKFFETTANLDMEEFYTPFLSRLPSKASLLDLGSGPGRDSAHFKKLGHRVKAIDGSKELSLLARKHFGIDVEVKDFFDIAYEHEFDGIWACASLLHISKEKLPLLFEKIERALKAQGLLYCSFKYGNSNEIRDARHFSDFTKEEFEAFIQKESSLKIEKIWTSSDKRPGKEKELWLNALLRSKEGK